jgi:hypothetical protein
MNLQFGLNSALPKCLTAAWGARLIFPDDLVWDRQSFPGRDTLLGEKLHHWLNAEGALRTALKSARRMSAHFQLSPDDHKQVTLFEDEIGIIVANPQSSFGYLYVAAWIKEDSRINEPIRDEFAAIVSGWTLISGLTDLTDRIERAAEWTKANGPLLPREEATIELMIKCQIARGIERGDFNLEDEA